MAVTLQPADVFFTRGPGLLSRLIRFFTRAIGESRTQVNHVGVVVEGGTLDKAVVIEALSRVRRHRLYAEYGPPAKDHVAVFRPTTLTPDQVQTVVAAANRYNGRRYGTLLLVAHFLDWVLLGAYLFRRLVGQDRYPICSWLVAYSFEKAGQHFGVPADVADPDDIWDFLQTHPNAYRLIRPLGPLP